jgi:hypothetical protein
MVEPPGLSECAVAVREFASEGNARESAGGGRRAAGGCVSAAGARGRVAQHWLKV